MHYLRFYAKKVNCSVIMAPKIQSINIHALLQDQHRLAGVSSVDAQLPANLQAILNPLFGDVFSVLFTTNKPSEMTGPAFVFLLTLSDDILELEETKDGKRRLFKLMFGSRFLSVNKRRAMGDDFKLFADRLKVLGVHLQGSTYPFWAKFLKNGDAETVAFQPVQDSEKLSRTTAVALLQLAQKIGRPGVVDRTPSTTENSVCTQLAEVKDLMLAILETAQQVIITNSELVKNTQTRVYTFSITAKYATFVERSLVMQNTWELDLITMKSTLNKAPFSANSADWLSMKIDAVAQDVLANRAEMYRK